MGRQAAIETVRYPRAASTDPWMGLIPGENDVGGSHELLLLPRRGQGLVPTARGARFLESTLIIRSSLVKESSSLPSDRPGQS